MGGSSNESQGQAPTVYCGVRVQSSVFGKAIALVYGTSRCACNLIWWGNFTAKQTDNGGGK